MSQIESGVHVGWPTQALRADNMSSICPNFRKTTKGKEERHVQ
jgi:hypothetical protein